MDFQKGLNEAPKRYERPEDLFRCQAALMKWVREAGHCHLLHKGDIGHRLFNGGYGYDPGDLLRFWLDEKDEIAAFALLSPHWEMFELQLAPRPLAQRRPRRDDGLLRRRVTAFGCSLPYLAQSDRGRS